MVILIGDPAHGLALAAGVLPGAAIGVPAAHRSRVSIAILDVLVGICVTIGSFLYAPAPVVLAAAALIAVTAMAATRLSRRYVTPAFTTFVGSCYCSTAARRMPKTGLRSGSWNRCWGWPGQCCSGC